MNIFQLCNVQIVIIFFFFNNFTSGLQCYKSACWGDECLGFEDRRDELIDRCPTDAQGCLFSFGTVKPDSNSALFVKGRVDGWGKPLRRETRSCFVPLTKKGGIVPIGELDKCSPTTMNHWLSREAQMVYVNSLECICSGNLCNGKVMSWNSARGRLPLPLMNILIIIIAIVASL